MAEPTAASEREKATADVESDPALIEDLRRADMQPDSEARPFTPGRRGYAFPEAGSRGLKSSGTGGQHSDAAPDRAEKERRRDENAGMAESLLYGTGVWEEGYAAAMSAAGAYATMAAYWQARIEWEHSVGY